MQRSRRLFSKKRRRGASLVEFALAAPILFALVLGIIEMGRVMLVQNQMSNAAREGCRVAALGNVQSDADVYDTIESHLDSATRSSLTRTLSPSLSGAESGDPVTVTLSVQYSDVSWVPMPNIMGDARIQVSKTLVRE